MRTGKIMVLAAAAILSASLLAGCGSSNEDKETKTKTEDTAKKDKTAENDKNKKKEEAKVIEPKKKTEDVKVSDKSDNSGSQETAGGEENSNQDKTAGQEQTDSQEQSEESNESGTQENTDESSENQDAYTDEEGHYDPSGGRETYETAGYVLDVNGITMRIDEENIGGRTYGGEGEDRAVEYNIGMAIVDCPVIIKSGLSVEVEYYVEDGVNYAVHIYSDGDEKEPIG